MARILSIGLLLGAAAGLPGKGILNGSSVSRQLRAGGSCIPRAADVEVFCPEARDVLQSEDYASAAECYQTFFLSSECDDTCQFVPSDTMTCTSVTLAATCPQSPDSFDAYMLTHLATTCSQYDGSSDDCFINNCYYYEDSAGDGNGSGSSVEDSYEISNVETMAYTYINVRLRNEHYDGVRFNIADRHGNSQFADDIYFSSSYQSITKIIYLEKWENLMMVWSPYGLAEYEVSFADVHGSIVRLEPTSSTTLYTYYYILAYEFITIRTQTGSNPNGTTFNLYHSAHQHWMFEQPQTLEKPNYTYYTSVLAEEGTWTLHVYNGTWEGAAVDIIVSSDITGQEYCYLPSSEIVNEDEFRTFDFYVDPNRRDNDDDDEPQTTIEEGSIVGAIIGPLFGLVVVALIVVKARSSLRRNCCGGAAHHTAAAQAEAEQQATNDALKSKAVTDRLAAMNCPKSQIQGFQHP